MLGIANATPLDNHVLRIEFTDGSAGDVDCSFLLGSGLGVELRDPSYFRQVRIDTELRTVGGWFQGALSGATLAPSWSSSARSFARSAAVRLLRSRSSNAWAATARRMNVRSPVGVISTM